MRHGTAGRRHRNNNRGSNNGGRPRNSGPQRMQVFDSNGPEVRIRGTAHQVFEKYVLLAKDAASAGDRILAESYLQHAEHYQRVINAMAPDVQGNPGFVRDQQQQGAAPQNEDAQVEDLSLPSSILGASSQVESKANTGERTAELTSS